MKDIKLLAKIRSHFHILLCLIFVMFLKSPIQMAHNKLYNINCQQAVYRPVYMQPVGCSVVMLHCAAVRTVCCCMVCIQINTYQSGVIKMWMFLTAQGTRSFLVRYTTGSFLVRYTTGSVLVRYTTGSFLVRYTTGSFLDILQGVS